MPGRAALNSVDGAMTDIRGTKKGDRGQGISGDQTSAIGGAGRMGMSGEGSLADPMYTRIDKEVIGKGMNGTATGGMTGYNSGDGRTFSGAGSRREQD
jgi:hypothetical protein